jgi:spore coat protein U-like protein
MKKTLITSALALATLALSGTVMAGDTATVAVSANVVGTCKFFVPKTGAVAFGALDPSNPVLVNGVVTQPQFWCTKGASYTITDDNGAHKTGTTFRMQHSTTLTEFIPYPVGYTGTGLGTGPATPITMNIAATVLGASYSGSLAGNYADTVTLTIAP